MSLPHSCLFISRYFLGGLRAWDQFKNKFIKRKIKEGKKKEESVFEYVFKKCFQSVIIGKILTSFSTTKLPFTCDVTMSCRLLFFYLVVVSQPKNCKNCSLTCHNIVKKLKLIPLRLFWQDCTSNGNYLLSPSCITDITNSQ